jgi:hypothetical protein
MSWGRWQAARRVAIASLSQRSGRNSRQSSGQLAWSVTALTDTPAGSCRSCPACRSTGAAPPPSACRLWRSRCRPPPTRSAPAPRSSPRPAGGGPGASPTGWPQRSGAAPGRAPRPGAGPSAGSTCAAHPASAHAASTPTGALIGTWQRREDVVGEGFQASTDRGQLGRCEATHSLLPCAWDREDGSSHPIHQPQT